MEAVNNVPHYVSVKGWMERTGMTRTDTYRKLGEGVLKAKKIGRKTVIDFQAGITWLESLPDAAIITK
ncbi:hypothetical protein [Acetobacter senegalensis]|uniref:hypothetical protein n=1 Tax=Acetobacter senegalensis TaxID=446692 RepID=UPI00128BC844|nr:hypothetical protein [Acetobacter senegalensis]MPQ73634.1 hypothetical protein [Acetobacter senegalensis]